MIMVGLYSFFFFWQKRDRVVMKANNITFQVK